MAILLLPLDAGAPVGAVADRLLAQDDLVRVVVGDPAWSHPGVAVAHGDPRDPDLVGRAAEGARTAVFLLGSLRADAALAALVDAVAQAGVDRVVAVGESPSEAAAQALRRAPSYVLVSTARRRLISTARSSPEEIARAVDAADDMAGEPRLEVDLTDPAGRAELGL